jgi:hypothetical protein
MGSLRRAGRRDPATCVAAQLPAALPNIPEHFVPEETKDRSDTKMAIGDGLSIDHPEILAPTAAGASGSTAPKPHEIHGCSDTSAT